MKSNDPELTKSILQFFTGQAIAAYAPSPDHALAWSPMVLLVLATFSGFAIMLDDIPLAGGKYLRYLCFMRWTCQGLLAYFFSKHVEGGQGVVDYWAMDPVPPPWIIVITFLCYFVMCAVVIALLRLPASRLVMVNTPARGQRIAAHFSATDRLNREKDPAAIGAEANERIAALTTDQSLTSSLLDLDDYDGLVDQLQDNDEDEKDGKEGTFRDIRLTGLGEDDDGSSSSISRSLSHSSSSSFPQSEGARLVFRGVDVFVPRTDDYSLHHLCSSRGPGTGSLSRDRLRSEAGPSQDGSPLLQMQDLEASHGASPTSNAAYTVLPEHGASQASPERIAGSHPRPQSDDLGSCGSAQPHELQLLQGVSGRAHPGEMCVIMGPSGSGKTTLLEVLLGGRGWIRRRRARVAGAVLLNGQDQLSGSRCVLNQSKSAFLPKSAGGKLFLSELTVRETIEFAVALRFTIPGPAVATSLYRPRDIARSVPVGSVAGSCCSVC